MLGLINGILGGTLLVAGRKLFWLFIGILGFMFGMRWTASFFNGPDWLLLAIGLIVGFVFAMLAVFLQALAIRVAGFLSGGYALTILVGMIGIDSGSMYWTIFIIGGLIGIALVGFLFDWAIITFSSLAGASLVTDAFFSNSGSPQIILIVLFFVGIIIQGSLLRKGKKAS